MANNNTFNLGEFARKVYYAPIALGAHEVTLQNPKIVIEEKEDGSDASYLLITLQFENERKVDVRWYGIGAKIALDQLRNQLNDTTDYKAGKDFIKALKDKVVKVFVSRREYTANDGTPKSTLQYDFIEPQILDDKSEVVE